MTTTRSTTVPGWLLATAAKHRIGAWRCIGGLLLLALLFGQSRWEESWVEAAVFSLGLVLAGIATVGRLWCALYIAGRKTRQLTVDGPYSICRHPLYLFNAIGLIGIGFAAESVMLPLVLACGFAITYPAVMASEERRLEQMFGDPYRRYRAAVPRFFPRWSRPTQPNWVEVHTESFVRSIFDSVWFVFTVGALEVIEALHEFGVLPVLWSYY